MKLPKFPNLPKIRFAVLLPLLCLIALSAYALQTPISPISPLGPYVSGQPTAASLNFTFTTCDNSLGNSFVMTGREILLIENTDTMASHTATISSVADALGRTNDVTAYSLASGPTFAAFNFRGGVTGWRQGDGTVHLACSTTDIKFAILSTPQ